MGDQRKGETREDYLARRRGYNASHRDRQRAYDVARKEDRRAYEVARREKHRAASRTWDILHREEKRVYNRSRPFWKRRAQEAVSHAIRSGVMVRPNFCSLCGVQPPPNAVGASTIQAHHYLGYEPIHHLDVRWLCTSCHRYADQGELTPAD
jgi:hypothetical protein